MVMPPLSSAFAPLRITRMFRGLPEALKADCNPLTRARTATSTETVSAMPSAVISVVVLRTVRLRRLYARGIAILARIPQRFEDRRARRVERGDERTGDADDEGDGHQGSADVGGDGERLHRLNK